MISLKWAHFRVIAVIIIDYSIIRISRTAIVAKIKLIWRYYGDRVHSGMPAQVTLGKILSPPLFFVVHLTHPRYRRLPLSHYIKIMQLS